MEMGTVCLRGNGTGKAMCVCCVISLGVLSVKVEVGVRQERGK